ncbi:hypothetical protein DPMN_111126 [Dreissena polymorpha]|uniref:Uncharacterized protein n=1 Tax=Dreissena polymorpha TaxID=45954 RepID=A0A9D4KD96_DREPO|nr:hypothetical protein DPMN_111126 [Dreissena polymorpha]
MLKEMKKLQDDQEASIRYVQSTYDKQLHTIQETRREINLVLDTIEQKTLKEMKDTLTKLQAASKSDVEKRVRLQDELKQLRDAIQDISYKSKLELSFIATRKWEEKIKQSYIFLKKDSHQVKISITFQPNTKIVQYLSKLPGLGSIEHSTHMVMEQEDPNKVFTVQWKSVQNVRISSDSFQCSISAICVLLDGQILVVDSNNKKVKLLDQQYQVVSHCSMTGYPHDLCQTIPSEVAVTLNDHENYTHEVQFITVNNNMLVTGWKFQVLHTCYGIAHHQGDLYITAGTALYKYTMSGRQISKMYEDKLGPNTGKTQSGLI